jgi:hypothetical protein
MAENVRYYAISQAFEAVQLGSPYFWPGAHPEFVIGWEGRWT